MTDQQAPKGRDAPERIWIQSDHIPDAVALDKWDQKPDPDENHLFTEYTRADLLTAAQARIGELEAKLAKAEEALRECEADIDGHIWHEYPGDHPVHARYRKRDFDANPARVALAELIGGKDND
jgi:hypothetical protein